MSLPMDKVQRGRAPHLLAPTPITLMEEFKAKVQVCIYVYLRLVQCMYVRTYVRRRRAPHLQAALMTLLEKLNVKAQVCM